MKIKSCNGGQNYSGKFNLNPSLPIPMLSTFTHTLASRRGLSLSVPDKCVSQQVSFRVNWEYGLVGSRSSFDINRVYRRTCCLNTDTNGQISFSLHPYCNTPHPKKNFLTNLFCLYIQHVDWQNDHSSRKLKEKIINILKKILFFNLHIVDLFINERHLFHQKCQIVRLDHQFVETNSFFPISS